MTEKTMQKPLVCRNARCGASCDQITTQMMDLYNDIATCPYYERRDDLYMKEDTYQRGLEDAWECARKIIEFDRSKYYNPTFDGLTACEILSQFSASEAINKIKEHEGEKKSKEFLRIVVTGTAENPYYTIDYIDYEDGNIHNGYGSYNLSFVMQWKEEVFK